VGAPPTTPPIYENSRFTMTETSLPSTVRRIPSTPMQPTSAIPPILKLELSVETDMRNIDASQGGECTVLCKVTANYTHTPTIDPGPGFDGVIILHTAMLPWKLNLAKEAARAIVDSCGSRNRLGLVTLGKTNSVVSELNICTVPYKMALMRSISQMEDSEKHSVAVADGVKLALRLLERDARQGGHIFLISSGNFIRGDLPSERKTTIHAIAIGPLTYATNLRRLLLRNGAHLELPSQQELYQLRNLIRHLEAHPLSPPIPTIQARLEHPPEVKIYSLHPPLLHPSQVHDSLTIGLKPIQLC